MVDRWDNIEILRAIDRRQQETYRGGPMRGVNGLHLMEQITSGFVHQPQLVQGFVQELHIACDMGLLTFKVQPDPRPNLADADPDWYLQTVSDFAMTVEGQDRARGRMVVQPLPDPAEDDGRKLSNLILEEVAAAITEQYAPDEVADFLAEEGIPPAGTGSSGRHSLRGRARGPGRPVALAGLSAAGSTTGFCPARTLSCGHGSSNSSPGRAGGPRHGLCAGHLRAGPGRAGQRAVPAGFRLHPLIEAEARPQFLINKPEQGVFASMKAVEVRVRKLAGFGDEVIGVDLMNKAFGPGGPLTDVSAGKGEQDGTRMLFAGAYAVLRNPAGHRQVDYDDLSEAAEAVQTASLLMRILDRVDDRLLAAGRNATGPSR